MGDYLIVLAVAAVGTYGLAFPVRRLATRLGVVDVPDERRAHVRPTPTVGGVAMFVAFLLAMAVASLLGRFHHVFVESSEPLGIVLGAAVIVAVGLADDIREMSAPAKLAGQVLAAMVLVLLGVTMFWFKIPFAGTVVLSAQVLPLLTAVWVVGITNAVNLIDGLDGLAAGIVAIASGALAIYGFRLVERGSLPADNLGPLIAVVALGVCIGFLPHNFNPARIFMGDTGALFLGLLMAVSTMEIGGRTTEITGQTYFFFAPLFIPFSILGVPILDTVLAVVRRTTRRTGIAHPDRDHLHHRLVRLGHGPRRTVLLLWAWTAVLSAFALYPTFDKRADIAIYFVVAFLVVALLTVFRPGAHLHDVVREPDERSEHPPVTIDDPSAAPTERSAAAAVEGPAAVTVYDQMATAAEGLPPAPAPALRGAAAQVEVGARFAPPDDLARG